MNPTALAAISRAMSSNTLELISPPPGWPHPSPPPPARPSTSTSSTPPSTPPLLRPHIAILDSSFNPPTTAHLALARTAFPPPPPSAHDEDPGPYTARLLLYSPKNADKVPGPGDAGVAARVEMMLALAAVCSTDTAAVGADPDAEHTLPVPAALPTAVGLLPHPTFAAKAAALAALPCNPHLTFIVGSDTLARIVDPKYYGDMGAALRALFGRARLVSVDRGEDVARMPGVQEWVARGKVRIVSVDAAQGVSSSRVRGDIKAGNGVRGVPAGVEGIVLREGLYR